MSDIRSLYEKFLMRDLLSFVVPGGIVLLTPYFLWREPLSWLFDMNVSFTEIPFLAYIFLFAVFYVVGLAVQCFGRMTGIIAADPYCNVEEYLKHLKGVLNSNNELVIQQHERFVALKQICGNNALAIAIGGILTLIELYRFTQSLSCVLSSLVILIVVSGSLFVGNRKRAKIQKIWEEMTGAAS